MHDLNISQMLLALVLILTGMFLLGCISQEESASWNDDPCGDLPPVYGSDC